MASRIVHFGEDTCHRLAVLRMAGYDVEECRSESELDTVLQMKQAPDAILVAEESVRREMSLLARARDLAPLVLFRQTHRLANDSAFDLVVPALEPPAAWLSELDSLLAKCRANRAQSALLIMKSRQLCQESAILRAQSVQERRRACRERNRKPGPGEGFVRGPEPPRTH